MNNPANKRMSGFPIYIIEGEEKSLVDDEVDNVENIVISINDNNDVVMGGAPIKPGKPIDVPSYRKGLVTGKELDEEYNSLTESYAGYKSYEEALEAGLQAALNLIK